MNINKIIENITQLWQFTRYNFKIIFANKFGYFLFAAIVFFLIVTGAVLYNDATLDDAGMYNLLMFPALLLIFYPTVFGIQNDKESRMLENLFGIPNYRYKVWLVRLGMIFLMVFLILCALGWMTEILIIKIPILEMTFQLMFPVLFIGCLSFMFSTWVKNGNATAVIMIVIGLFFWILFQLLEESKWYIFLNPFHSPRSVSQTVWVNIVFLNRIYLSIGSFVAVLFGLLNLQKREKFV
ncbi:MAG: hypothetical protein JEZ03_15690 [Bacteroidales bacterium]|nr:hypothetical protein [Bacteroidales bacterium]